MTRSKALLGELSDAVVSGNTQKARGLAERLVNEGVPASTLLDKMMEAMRTVDKRFERMEYFTMDVAAASTAMKEAIKILEPYLNVKPANVSGTVVIGSLRGNVQGLGKDIVASGDTFTPISTTWNPADLSAAATMSFPNPWTFPLKDPITTVPLTFAGLTFR